MQQRNTRLLQLAKEGDREASDRLVLDNLGLVRSIALRFRERGTDYEDLVQIGVIGMMKAIRSFDLNYGTAFSTYAVPLIIGEIRRHLRDDGSIKVSRTLKQHGAQLMRERERFLAEKGREPRIGELAERCGLTTEAAAEAMDAAAPVASLSEPAGDDDSLTLEGTLADASSPLEQIGDRIALGEAIAELPEQQRKILIMRYYRGLSQQQTGELLGLSQVKISREEKKILSLLRMELQSE